MDVEIAKTIRQQISPQTLMMMGAWNQTAHADGFSFRFRGSRRVNYLRVKLDPMDTYTMEFCRIGRAPRFTISNEVSFERVYFDMLHSTIEKVTGLYTKLF